MASVFPAEPAMKHDESDVTYFPVTAGQTFKKGALCVLATGAASECGTNPAAIHGLALCDASVGLDAKGSIYGGTNIPFIVLQPDMVLKLSSATAPVFATHMGNIYGVTKTAGGVWQLDISKVTTDARFTVVGIRPMQGVQGGAEPEMFLCKILPQYNPFAGILS